MSGEHPLQGRVAMVTGASGGMGRVISTALARQGADVVLVVRREMQGQALAQEIIQTTGNQKVSVLVADLARQASIREMAERFHNHHDRLHVLVNNAGVHAQTRQLSPDGLELQFAVNHLGWFLLTQLLLETLIAGAPARVVNVTSHSMADTRAFTLFGKPRPAVPNLADLQSEHAFEAMDAYARSKLAMLMCGYALARRLQTTGVTVNALHPGLVATDIVTAVTPPLMRPFSRRKKEPGQRSISRVHQTWRVLPGGTSSRRHKYSHRTFRTMWAFRSNCGRRAWISSLRLV
jgi:retinol dehydrogenase-12